MQETAECQCKANVQPGNCDTCIDGSFDLQESNPDGCTDCFCSGKSTYCQSHDRLVRSKVRNPFHFTLQGVPTTFKKWEIREFIILLFWPKFRQIEGRSAVLSRNANKLWRIFRLFWFWWIFSKFLFNSCWDTRYYQKENLHCDPKKLLMILCRLRQWRIGEWHPGNFPRFLLRKN